MAGHGLAVFFAGGAMAEGQGLHGAGEGYVEEAALFVQGAFDFGS